LSSGLGDDFGPSVIAAMAATGVFDDGPDTAPDLTIDPADHADTVGHWHDPLGIVGNMSVSLEGDTVTVELPDLDHWGYSYSPELEPYLPGVYILRIEGTAYDLTFIEDVAVPDGPSRWARNRGFVFERSSDTPLLPRAPVEVSGPDPRQGFEPAFGLPLLR